MKKILVMALMLFALIILATCGGSDDTQEPTMTQDENNLPDEVTMEEIKIEEIQVEEIQIEENDFSLSEFAAPFFARLQYIWDEDNGEMWGMPLHSSVIIFCVDSGMAAANRPDAEGELVYADVDGVAVYMGERRMFRSRISHGFWNGERAIFIRLQDMLDNPYQAMAEIIYTHDVNIGLVNHYIIHWKQHNGILPQGLGQSPSGSYSIGNNINYMMEINALIEAIIADDELEQIKHIHQALSVRHIRRTDSRNADLGVRENGQIITEGLPTYTEMVLPLSGEELKYSIKLWPEFILWRGQDISLSYGYFGGALYGILLDALGISWRPYVSEDIDLGDLLIAHLGIIYFIPLDEIDLEQYGYSEISRRLGN